MGHAHLVQTNTKQYKMYKMPVLDTALFQHRTMIPERKVTNEVSTTIIRTFCLEAGSRVSCREREPKQSLVWLCGRDREQSSKRLSQQDFQGRNTGKIGPIQRASSRNLARRPFEQWTEYKSVHAQGGISLRQEKERLLGSYETNTFQSSHRAERR